MGSGNDSRLVLYAAVGPQLTHYDVANDGSAFIKRGSVTLPANVQYAWPHVSKRYLYVASSSRPSGMPVKAAGNTHHITAFSIDASSGALKQIGEPVALKYRPVHTTTDMPSDYALVAYNEPCDLTVHRINSDGSLSEEIKQPAVLDVGIYAHQVRVTPSNDTVILVTRGNDATAERDEDPGALKVFGYKNGILTNRASIAPNGGYGFGPRHLDFHPNQPWVYVSLERQNKLHVYQLDGQTLSTEPLFVKDTSAIPSQHIQWAGTIHVHPSGRFVYVINRAYATMDLKGQRVFRGGENSIAVYAIDQHTGEPTLIQSVDTQGIYARTFVIDPNGRTLIAANSTTLRTTDNLTIPASLAVFHIGAEGKLDFKRREIIDTRGTPMFWTGLLAL